MRPMKLTVALLALPLGIPAAAQAGSTYIALGDSITFGETDLQYIPSEGDRGYVGRYADHLAARNGERPEVINLAIDGETADSFMDGTGRTPPVVGRNDPILAAQNANYGPTVLVPQRELFRSKAAAARAAGDTIDTVSITLGFNEVAALAATPDTALAMLPSTLETYRANYAAVLAEIREQAPDAELFVLNYFNPFPADPASSAAPIFAAGGAQLNAIIQRTGG